MRPGEGHGETAKSSHSFAGVEFDNVTTVGPQDERNSRIFQRAVIYSNNAIKATFERFTCLLLSTGISVLKIQTRLEASEQQNALKKVSSPTKLVVLLSASHQQKGRTMPRRYTISKERREQLSQQRSEANRTPEMKAARSTFMAEFNKTPEMREARSADMTERHKDPDYTAKVAAARWPKSQI